MKLLGRLRTRLEDPVYEGDMAGLDTELTSVLLTAAGSYIAPPFLRAALTRGGLTHFAFPRDAEQAVVAVEGLGEPVLPLVQRREVDLGALSDEGVRMLAKLIVLGLARPVAGG